MHPSGHSITLFGTWVHHILDLWRPRGKGREEQMNAVKLHYAGCRDLQKKVSTRISASAAQIFGDSSLSLASHLNFMP